LLIGNHYLAPDIKVDIVALLGKDLETNNETAVAMQRRGKYVSGTIALLLETVFCTRSVQSGYKEGKWGDPIT
jgi:hypothetical protein